MEKIGINRESLDKEQTEFEEIILDVVQSQTTTLTKYPNTLLGRIFSNPSNCNKEYLHNRNGRAFHYIMEFYRTGKLLWPDEIQEKMQNTQEIPERMEDTQQNLETKFEEIIFDVGGEEITFDVGGIKYRIKRSTLTKYPNTLLGRIFLNPLNCNKEYFFNRNGRAFYYIMEFYRTGKLLWPGGHDGVTYEEVEREFVYFNILPERNDDEIFEIFDHDDHIFKYMGGRKFLIFEDARYLLPFDDDEHARLQLQHFLYRHMWNSNFSSPVHELLQNSHATVLDIGSMNLTFTSQEWENVVIKELVRVVKPGGWIEIMERDPWVTGAGPVTDKFNKICANELKTRYNVDPFISPHISSYMLSTQKFMEIFHEEKKMIVGETHDNLSKVCLDNYKWFRKNCKGSIGTKIENFDKMLNESFNEIQDKKAYEMSHRFFAMKKIDENSLN
ncbi:1408_t:CDS:2 [Diversispora eburnea]|uniref:1408_t:CDS:1 n=1 Tax=Diversispora eburnea TaxID=1213867 RepID=A0A9N8WS79_9GLOM|nr:1408_t:CDS:2 [Diversispora eburnea]